MLSFESGTEESETSAPSTDLVMGLLDFLNISFLFQTVTKPQ